MPTAAARPVALLVLGLCMLAGRATAADPAAIARSGAPGIAPCASCHGASGEGKGNFPRLAGMNAIYLARQLEEFASGKRSSAVMTPVAKALDASERSALAGYYAQLPVPPAASPASSDPNGRQLALRGAWSKGVPACVQCHGPGGRGVGASFPALAGQTAGYLSAQLRAFRTGQRGNDPLQLMRGPASKLTDEEIDAVARWFAAQPSQRPKETR